MTQKINVSATVHASTDSVWDCYTNPEHITQWNFADPSWHCPSATNDMQIGGKYTARMEAKDGSFGFDLEAIYSELDLKKHFTYIMPNGREVKVVFTNDNGATEVNITFDGDGENAIDMQKAGWQAILNNFKTYVEAL
ncbi:MAG: SRPBCC domain-containing protein [Flavobacteriaceae bacterium]|jgi:uncharacterized protein YndB with AHSA1/START domain|nr:SRPBCC domain-containing protein [Flavobacteriaceae bacterium]